MFKKMAALVLLLSFCFGASAFAAADRLEKLLPEKTLAVLSVENAAKIVADTRKDIDDFEKDEASRDLTVSIKRSLAPYFGMIENRMGLKLNDVLDNFSGQLVVAVVDEGAAKPSFLLMARMKNPALFQNLIEQVVKMSGAPLFVNNLGQPAIHGVRDDAYWTGVNDLFLFSNSEKSLVDLVGRLANPPANNFLANKRYAQVCPKPDAAGLVMFLDMPNVISCVDRNKKIDMISHAILKGLGVFEMEGVALNIPSGGGPSSLSVLAPNSKASILHLVKSFKNPGFKMQEWLPADSSSKPAYLGFYIDIPSIWKYALETMKTEKPEDFPAFQAKLAKMEEMLGFKIEDDLINNLTGEFAVYSPSGFFPNGFYLGVKDEIKMKKVMAAAEKGLIGLAANVLERTQLAGVEPWFSEITYKKYSIRRLENGGFIACLPNAYTFYKGSLIFSKTALIKDLLNDEKTPPLNAHPDFKAAMAKLPPNCLAVAYSDSRPVVDMYNEYVSYLLSFGNLGMMALKQRSGIGINLEDLPSLKYLFRNSKPTIAYMHANPQGVHFSAEISGPLPPVYGVSGIAIVAAIAIPSLLENQKAANENAAQSTLRSIVFAQATYKTMNNKFAPNIAALVEARLLNREEFKVLTKNGASTAPILGYVFTQEECTDNSFRVSAEPESATAGINKYSVDTSGMVRIVPPGDPEPINPPVQEEQPDEEEEGNE